jgi:hypothetical protein
MDMEINRNRSEATASDERDLLRERHGKDRLTATVLLVEPNEVLRDQYGAWLEEAGLQPINCPGPHAPDFTCLGARGERCALSMAADIVVLDSQPLSTVSRKGLPGWRLLRHYLALGKPVVVISSQPHRKQSFRIEQIACLTADPGRESLLLAVRRLLRDAQHW